MAPTSHSERVTDMEFDSQSTKSKTFHTFMDFDNPASLPGILIPQQRVWIPQTAYKFGDEAVIALSAAVRLVDALNGHCKNPVDPPILGLDMTGVVFKLRWPGYFEYTSPRTSILSVAKFTEFAAAVKVAKFVHEFYGNTIGTNTWSAEPEWDLRRIAFDTLYLVGLRRVSQGSMQPVLVYDAA